MLCMALPLSYPRNAYLLLLLFYLLRQELASNLKPSHARLPSAETDMFSHLTLPFLNFLHHFGTLLGIVSNILLLSSSGIAFTCEIYFHNFPTVLRYSGSTLPLYILSLGSIFTTGGFSFYGLGLSFPSLGHLQPNDELNSGYSFPSLCLFLALRQFQPVYLPAPCVVNFSY